MTGTPKKLSPQEYRHLLASELAPLLTAKSCTIPSQEALGRTLAKDLYAREDQPAFANSQMDGYAITTAAATASTRIFTVGPDLPAGAGQQQRQISDSLAYPIMTGAALPAGYSTVIPEELAEPQGQTEGNFALCGSEVYLPPAPAGQYVRQAGQDIAAGQLLIPAQTQLSPVDLALLAAQGIKKLPVLQPPSVLILTGGDEIKNTSSVAQASIRDANGPMLTALLQADGVQSQHLRITDNPQDLLEKLTKILAKNPPQLIVSSGGISHGKYEVIKQVGQLLSQASPTDLHAKKTWFGQVSQQPAGPQALMLLETPAPEKTSLPWLAFPGNPVSTLVSYTLLLRPLLSQKTSQEPTAHYGKLVSPSRLQGLKDKTQYLRGRAQTSQQEDGSLQVQLTDDPQAGSHQLYRASQANALIELEAASSYRNGDTLRYYPLTAEATYPRKTEAWPQKRP